MFCISMHDIPLACHVPGRGSPSRAQRVECVAHAAAPDGSPIIAVGRASGVVDVLDRGSGALLASFHGEVGEDGATPSGKSGDEASAAVVGLHAVPAAPDGDAVSGAATPTALRMLCVTRGGTVSMHAPSTSDARSWERQLHWNASRNVQCTVGAWCVYVCVGWRRGETGCVARRRDVTTRPVWGAMGTELCQGTCMATRRSAA